MKLDLRTGLILLSVILVTSVGSAYITTWVFNARTPVDAPLPIQALNGSGVRGNGPFDPRLVWSTGTFTVNLAPTPGGGQRFVRAEMSFQVNDAKTVAELDRRQVQVRDRIITILRTTSPDQLGNEKGILTLKERIVEDVQDLVIDVGGRIYETYLTELVIQ